MMTRDELLAARCRPRTSGAMSESEIRAQLAVLPAWEYVDGAIARSYRFANYHETIGFVNALAWIANAEDHHPDLAVGYDRCTVRFNTHSVGGICDNDFICAAKADALYAQRPATSAA